MEQFEKFYTVDDIAKMSMLTTRTIRTYLKDGILSGRKIGGQWRFTEADVEKFLNNSDTIKALSEAHRQDVQDFIDGVDTDLTGVIQICAAADYYTDSETARRLTESFCQLIAQASGVNKFYYDYVEAQGKASYVFMGTPGFVSAAASVLAELWDEIYKSQALFSGKSENYEKYRPSYPKASIELINSLCKSPVIADIGAGTGKLSALLVKDCKKLYCVEPNDDMREKLEATLGKNENCLILGTNAESTGLDADSVDILCAAESYHWFDNPEAKHEFRRVLKKDGFAVLLWNEITGNPYDEENAEITKKFRTHKRAESGAATRSHRAESLFGKGNFSTAGFDNTIYQSYKQFLGGMLSASFTPKPGDNNYMEYERQLKVLFDKYAVDGKLETKINTLCFWGKLQSEN